MVSELKAVSIFSLPADVTMAVFVIGARTPEGWDFMYEKYRHSMQLSVKSRLKIAMTISPMQDKLKWCVLYVKLDISVKSSRRKGNETPSPILSFCLQDDGAEPPW